MSEEYGGGSPDCASDSLKRRQAMFPLISLPTLFPLLTARIYLETEMFNAGFRPAVNAGLSVFPV